MSWYSYVAAPIQVRVFGIFRTAPRNVVLLSVVVPCGFCTNGSVVCFASPLPQVSVLVTAFLSPCSASTFLYCFICFLCKRIPRAVPPNAFQAFVHQQNCAVSSKGFACQVIIGMMYFADLRADNLFLRQTY
ncbi:unnamed protein product [Ixodes pacificus]